MGGQMDGRIDGRRLGGWMDGWMCRWVCCGWVCVGRWVGEHATWRFLFFSSRLRCLWAWWTLQSRIHKIDPGMKGALCHRTYPIGGAPDAR